MGIFFGGVRLHEDMRTRFSVAGTQAWVEFRPSALGGWEVESHVFGSDGKPAIRGSRLISASPFKERERGAALEIAPVPPGQTSKEVKPGDVMAALRAFDERGRPVFQVQFNELKSPYAEMHIELMPLRS